MKSKHINIPPFFYIIGAVLLRALNQIVFKILAIQPGMTVTNLFGDILFYLSIIILFTRAVVWQKALANFNLSFVYPFNALVIIMLMACGVMIFDEPVDTSNMVGAGFILCGILFMSLKEKKKYVI
jgi:drug/metabolite transporter (DMT)-like permease